MTSPYIWKRYDFDIIHSIVLQTPRPSFSQAQSTSSFSTLRSLLASLPAVLKPSQKVEATEQLEERAKSHHFSERNQEQKSADGDDEEGESEDTGGDEDEDGREVSRKNKGKGKAGPAHYAPSEEVQAFLFDVLTWRDGIARGVAAGIESIPGLGDLLEQLMDLLNQCA